MNEQIGITFEQLCDYVDNLVVDDIIEVPLKSVQQEKEKVKSNVLEYTYYNNVKSETLKVENDKIFKIKKMSTNQLKRIFRSNRSYECNDRDTLILVVSIILSDTDYQEQISKRTFSVSLMDKIETTKLSWEDIKNIRRLYNIKFGKDSCYSFKEIGDLYNLSHIFTRNICLGKVYKEKKG